MTVSVDKVQRSHASFARARGAVAGLAGPDPAVLCPGHEHEGAWVSLREGSVRGRAIAQPLRGHDGIGIVGFFECVDDPSAARALLGACEDFLAQAGCRRVIGPMDGDTWHNYRTAEASEFAPFALDRITPAWYGELFRGAGYHASEEYISTWIERSELSWARLDRGLERLARAGGRIESFDPVDWERQLDRLHALSLEAFAGNAWASPLDREVFHRLYAGYRDRIAPDWIQWALAADGTALGYVFSIPDRRPDGARIRVIKTVAVADHPRARGLGALLVELTHRRAHEEGCSGVVHALMHERNSSTHILSKHAQVVRRYHLWAKEIS